MSSLMSCNPSGFSVNRIFQARILEWVAIFSSRRSSRPRDWTCVSCISLRDGLRGGFFATEPSGKLARRKPLINKSGYKSPLCTGKAHLYPPWEDLWSACSFPSRVATSTSNTCQWAAVESACCSSQVWLKTARPSCPSCVFRLGKGASSLVPGLHSASLLSLACMPGPLPPAYPHPVLSQALSPELIQSLSYHSWLTINAKLGRVLFLS